MARLGSQSKGGFIATPLKEIELIIPHLKINYQEEAPYLNIYDPCCGEGVALHHFEVLLQQQTKAKVTSYGVELEETRFHTAKTNVNHALHEGFESVRTENKMSLLWLNPPYDNAFRERTELIFLRTLTTGNKKVLMPNGLLLFCIPQHVLKDCAPILANYFQNVRVYRFSEENFLPYAQVVVFGYLKKPTQKEKRSTIKILEEMSEMDPDFIPTLEELDEEFTVPTHKEEIHLFRAGRLNPKEVELDLKESIVFEEFERRVNPKKNNAVMKQPLLPLKSTHIGIAVASGAVGGNLGNHIVKGITKQVQHTSPVYNIEGENTGYQISKFYNSVVRVFAKDGVFELK